MRDFFIGEAAAEDQIPPPLLLFLDRFRELDDRIEAAKASGITWKDVEEALAGSPAFRKAWEALWREKGVQVEDALRRRGARGDPGAAKSFLAAHDPVRYAPRLRIDHDHKVRVTERSAMEQQSWLDRLLPPAEVEEIIAAPADDEVEGEIVEPEIEN